MKKILNSPRFWLLFLTGVGAGLQVYITSKSLIMGIASAITVWTGGATVVGTVDRYSDKKVEVARIGAGLGV